MIKRDMMKNNALDIFKLLLFALIIGGFSAGIDYIRMINAEIPMFCKKDYDKKTKIETYTSLLYTAERRVIKNNKEPLYNSRNIKYNLFGIITIDIPNFPVNRSIFKIETIENESCNNISQLYYADKNIKVYTYCLESIEIQDETGNNPLSSYLEKDSLKTINEIEANMLLKNYDTSATEYYESTDVDFTEKGLSLYRCNQPNINDVYIGPKNMPFQSDFCTYKDDDFKFIYEIDEVEHSTASEPVPEVFYEDATYRYEFSEPKSDYIYIVAPAIRGKSEVRTPLKTVLYNNILTIDELEQKGLEFNKVSKAETPTE